MAHCGYEATAVADLVRKPWKGLKVAAKGIKTDGEMAPEIELENARKADYIFEGVVKKASEELDKAEKGAVSRSDAA
jgi:hypothetical protein